MDGPAEGVNRVRNHSDRRPPGEGHPGLRGHASTASRPRSGKEITFDQVLFVEKDGGEMLAGAPFVANAKVVGVVDGESRGPKIRVFKKKRRKGFRKTRGHRSTYTRVRVTDIVI